MHASISRPLLRIVFLLLALTPATKLRSQISTASTDDSAAIEIVAKFFKSASFTNSGSGIDSFIDGYEASLPDGSSTGAAESARSRLHSLYKSTAVTAAAPEPTAIPKADEPRPTPPPEPATPAAATPMTVPSAPAPATERVTPSPTPSPAIPAPVTKAGLALDILANGLANPPATAKSLDAVRFKEFDAAVHYLRDYPDRYAMVPIDTWLDKNYPEFSGVGAMWNKSEAAGGPETAALLLDLGPSSETHSTSSKQRLYGYYYLGQCLVNLGLNARSQYFYNALFTLVEIVESQERDNLPRCVAIAEKRLINQAVQDFTQQNKLLSEQTDSTVVSTWETGKADFSQDALADLKQRFENNLATVVSMAKKNTQAQVTPQPNQPGGSSSADMLVVSSLTPGSPPAQAGGSRAAGAPTPTPTSPSTETPADKTTTSGTDSTKVASAASTSSVSSYFQSTKINVGNRATLVQEELDSGYMRGFSRWTIGYEFEGTLPISSGAGNSTSGSNSSTTSSTPSAGNYVTAELLEFNGGILNVSFSPLQLTQAESPQGDGRQYQSDKYYWSHFWYRKDANGFEVPDEDRYDTSSILFYFRDGIGGKAYQKTVAASTTSSSIPDLAAAGIAYLGAGFDGPTYTGLTSKQSGYITAEGLTTLTVLNRNVINDVFTTASSTNTKNTQNNGRTSFETAEAKISFVDGKWALSAFYAVPLGYHTSKLMPSSFGFTFGTNSKSTKATPTPTPSP